MAMLEESHSNDRSPIDNDPRAARPGGATRADHVAADDDDDEFDDPEFVHRYFEAIEQSEAAEREDVARILAQQEAVGTNDDGGTQSAENPAGSYVLIVYFDPSSDLLYT